MVTTEIVIVLSILAMAVVLFVTAWLRMDVVALLVLGALALTGLVTPSEALSGFSNPAVVTVWAVFILSGGLSQTGVANRIGHHVLRLAGQGEFRLVTVIMLTAGGLSAFMNNTGVAALMLPVVMDIARRTGRPPSRLLIPLAFGSLLGGLTTLIGTAPNLLVSGALRDAGLRPFQLFDFTPVGAAVMLVGIVFMALVGRHLLPHRDPAHGSPAPADTDLQQLYELRERLFFIHVPADSVLSGKTLTESRLGSALGLNVIAIFRHGQTHLSPDPTTVLHAGDRLLVEGRLDWLNELRGRRHLVVEPNSLAIRELISSEIGLAEGRLSPTSSLAGQTLLQSNFRHRFGAQVLAIRRGGLTRRTNLQTIPLQPGDTLLIQGPHAQLEALRNTADFDSFRLVSDAELAESYRLHERVIVARVPPDSILVGRSLAERRLGDAFGLTVLGLIREGTTRLLPDPATPLEAEDTLLVEGKPEDLLILRGLQELDIDTETPLNLRELESERVGLAEVVLSPHTTLVGRTMRELHFREKYGLNVLAIWREGRAYRSNLRNMPLRFGDALLLYGPRENVKLLASEPDFLVLTPGAPAAPRPSKAPLAGLLMAAVIVPVMLGWLPISIAAVLGAAGMVVTGCLTMEEAYRFIDWRAVFLIAGMLPLAMAIEQTGAARFLADSVVTALGRFGPMGMMASLFMLTALAAQVMPTPAVAVLMAPMVIDSATDLGVSPHAFMMALAMSASASFMSPITHLVNVMIMGPGGYRFTDYTKVGFPLTLVVLAVVLLVVPRFWPLYP